MLYAYMQTVATLVPHFLVLFVHDMLVPHRRHNKKMERGKFSVATSAKLYEYNLGKRAQFISQIQIEIITRTFFALLHLCCPLYDAPSTFAKLLVRRTAHGHRSSIA